MRVHPLALLCVSIAAAFGPAFADAPARPLSPLSRLGKRLFFDKRLSSDQSVSCASCHKPALAFTNGLAVASGAHHQKGDRNVPTLVNRGGTSGQFWDRRVDSLEAQVIAVMGNTAEMGGDMEGALRRVRADAAYAAAFREVFHEEADMARISQALAAYERSLRAGQAPYDRYVAGQREALSPVARKGMDLFFNKFKCSSCHAGENFTDEKLNVRCYPFTAGLTAVPTQRFKTPTLRNLIYTAPYMHNGALTTLDEAIDFYNPSLHLNASGKPEAGAEPVFITKEEKKALIAFLKSLSADRPFVEAETD